MFVLFLSTLPWLLLLGNLVKVVGGSGFMSRAHKCELLTTRNVCTEQTRGHNLTSIPNLLGHKNQLEAEEQMASFQALMMYGCSKSLELFLCSAHFPYCTEKAPKLQIGPCQGMCESVRVSCEPVLNNFGFRWPQSLDCSKFPRFEVNPNCVDGPQDDVTMVGDGPPANHQTPDHPINILQKQKPKLRHEIQSHPCSHLKSPQNYLVTYTNDHVVICSRKCINHVAFSEEQKKRAEIVLLVVVVTCSGIFLAAMTSIILSKKKSANRQKFLFHVILCNAITCTSLLIRILIGREMTSCQRLVGTRPEAHVDNLTLISISPGYPVVMATRCFCLFVLMNFGIVASLSWFTMTTLLWCSNPRHSRRRTFYDLRGFRTYRRTISRKAKLCVNFLKISSWGFPVILSSCVVLSGAVSGDELLGLCFVSPKIPNIYFALYLIPVCIFCFLMMFYTLIGFVLRWRNKRCADTETQRDVRISGSIPAKNLHVSENFKILQKIKTVEEQLSNRQNDVKCSDTAHVNRSDQFTGQLRSGKQIELSDTKEERGIGKVCDCFNLRSQSPGIIRQQQEILSRQQHTSRQHTSQRRNFDENRNKKYLKMTQQSQQHYEGAYDGGVTCLIGSLSFVVVAGCSLIEVTNHDAIYHSDLENARPSHSSLVFWATMVRLTSLMVPGVICSLEILSEWMTKRNLENLTKKAKLQFMLKWQILRGSKDQTISRNFQDGDKMKRDNAGDDYDAGGDDDVNNLNNDEIKSRITTANQNRCSSKKMTHRSGDDDLHHATNTCQHNNMMMMMDNKCYHSDIKTGSHRHHYHYHRSQQHNHQPLQQNHHHTDVISSSECHQCNETLLPTTLIDRNINKQQDRLFKCCQQDQQHFNKILNSSSSYHPQRLSCSDMCYHGDDDDDDGDDDDDDDYDEELIEIMNSVLKRTNKSFKDNAKHDDDHDDDDDDDDDHKGGDDDDHKSGDDDDDCFSKRSFPIVSRDLDDFNLSNSTQ